MFSHGIDFNGVLALATVIVWPVIPLFWIPVHCRPEVFRRLGFATYLLPFGFWLPLAYVLFVNRTFLLGSRVHIPLILSIAGWILLISGTMIQIWTGKLLSLAGLAGVPEISGRAQGRLVTGGAFAFVRHPTYLSHTLMFSGVFLVTGVTVAGVVALIDFVLINAVIIPLEERELAVRFGNDFLEYKKKVPCFFPWPLSRKKMD